jgi:xanthine dehydrogenase accessory factor
MEPSQAWIEQLAALRSAGRPCALVVVTATTGSAPREPGARMLVADGQLVWGTIGGGKLEQLALERAGELLARPGIASETMVVPLAEVAGQCCGGSVTLFLETFRWRSRTVAIFGAGHVGQALAALQPWLGVRVVLIDSREPAEIRPALPRERPYELVTTHAPEAELVELPADALVVVMTHSHALDLELVHAALQRGTFPFVGLIGSARKWKRFHRRLAERGHSPERLASIACPIGLAKASKMPAAIALSAAAQLADVMARLPA